MDAPSSLRIDKLLWFLRFAKTRNLAQDIAEAGHIRLNGRRVERAHQRIAVKDVLVIPLPSGVRVIEILALPERRNSAAITQTYYRDLDVASSYLIAAP